MDRTFALHAAAEKGLAAVEVFRREDDLGRFAFFAQVRGKTLAQDLGLRVVEQVALAPGERQRITQRVLFVVLQPHQTRKAAL